MNLAQAYPLILKIPKIPLMPCGVPLTALKVF